MPLSPCALSAPLFCSLEYVYATRNWSPREKRRSSTNSSAWYWLSPVGTPRHWICWYCGYCRSACATLPTNPGYGDLIPAPARAAELMSDCSTVAPSRQHARVVHVGVHAQRLEVVIQPAPAVPDVRDVQHHVVGELMLRRHGPVLEARQRQPVRSHRDRRGPPLANVGSMNGGWTMRFSREAVVEIERRVQTVGQVRREQVRLEPERRLADELIERHAGVVDPVAAADRVLVVRRR